MSLFKNIAVIGGGSWATAIIKMLSENQESLSWWMRNDDNIAHIKRYGNNPNYISARGQDGAEGPSFGVAPSVLSILMRFTIQAIR